MTDSFDNLLNFRDVGVTVNKRNVVNNQQHLRPGLIYRSARPDGLSRRDREKLVNQYGIRTVIDLRSKTEHIEAAKKFNAAARLVQPATVPSLNSVIAQPLKIPEIDYAEINLNGKGFERHLIWQLSYMNLAKLVAYMSVGYRLEGISILGRNVLKPRGLIGLAEDTLQHSGPEIKEVFKILAQRSSYPVLIHCTQGKDRTGLIVLLVLLLCGVNTDMIDYDYRLSEEALKPELAERVKEITSIGLDESFARCPPEFTPRVVDFVNQKLGGIERYLQSIGISQEDLKLTRSLLCSQQIDK